MSLLRRRTSRIAKGVEGKIMKIRSSIQLTFLLVVVMEFCLPVFSQNIQNPQSAADFLMRSSMKIDPATGAMQVKVPSGAIAGRGEASLPVELNYSSKVWNIKHQSTFSCNGEPVTSYRPEFARSSAPFVRLLHLHACSWQLCYQRRSRLPPPAAQVPEARGHLFPKRIR